MNNDILIQSVLTGYSIICIKPLVSSLNIKTDLLFMGLHSHFFGVQFQLFQLFQLWLRYIYQLMFTIL